MAYGKFIAKLSYSSLQFLKRLYNFFDAVLSGFWLGVLSEKSLDFYVELHYNRSRKYTDDIYNLSGLLGWEKERIEKYFSNAKSILLIAAGGGRETAALSRMGFEVDSYECNTNLIEYGNLFLQKNSIDSGIKYLPENSVPVEIKKYDGIIIGWAAYSHVQGNKKRISFLTKLYPFLNKESPLMISFLTKEEKGTQDKIVKNVSNFFRFFSGKDKTESGDRLMSYFVHFFNEKEIQSELAQSKFRVIDYYDIEYGCAIATI
jgi:2-polyprenyl-3-methyl-5-hydroxy-6-metoxy-1,4-benzoquinol methylase